MAENLNNKIVSATKWSTITEIAAKLAAPISGMVMARILTPEAYGAMAAISIIISFTELFTDVGFKRYIIQHEFNSDEEKYRSTNVAFWTNLALSLFFWILIVIFRNQLASAVGSPELGLGIVVACAGIPISAFSSLQTALYQRDFDFKTLFYVRLVGIAMPFVVNIPLALITRNYWALIIGGILSSTVTAVILTIKSKWKPQLFYDFGLLKEMFAFSMWLMFDSILVWATSYIDIFLIGRGLNEHYLGLYRVSTNIVNQLLALVTASILPVLLPALSRVQFDIPAMKTIILKFQKYSSIIVVPLGVGIFMFRDLITNLMLGSQWTEAADFIGLWGLISALMIILSRFCACVFPAIGKPKYGILSQVLHLAFVIPATVIAVQYGFTALYITRSLVRFQGLIVDFIIVYALIKLSPWKMIANIMPEVLSSIIMGVVAYFILRMSDSIIWGFLSVVICGSLYFLVLYYLFPSDRVYIKKVYDYCSGVLAKFKK